MLDNVGSGGARPMQVDRKPKAFRISTALGEGAGQDESDPLLLAQISGSEAVSAAYAFELTVLQKKTDSLGRPRPAINPSEMINTQASFGISESKNGDSFWEWHDRHGTIEHFEELADSPFRNMRSYTARIVPMLKLLDRERTFRVFEDVTVMTVIRAVLQAHGDIPTNYTILTFDESLLPRLPYIVQFGEDTLSFVHRLLAMHGIWYYFIHGDGARNEQMLLGQGPKVHPPGSTILQVSGAPEEGQIGGYRRLYAPGPKRIVVGEFNPIDPTNPFQGIAKILPTYDIAKAGEINPPGRFQHRIFPATIQDNPGLQAEAKQRMEAIESQIVTTVGQTKNRSLRVGNGLLVDVGNQEQRQKSVVTALSIHGLDANFNNEIKSLGGFLSLCFNGLNPFSDGKLSDVSSVIAQSEIGQFLRGVANTAGGVAGPVTTVAGAIPSPISALVALPSLITKAADRVGSVAAGVTPVTDAAKKFLDGAQFDFGNSFVGTSQIELGFDKFLLPPPVAVRQVARGPHVAVVIGQSGATVTGDDVWADALGRVRVRFPWEPADESGDPLALPPFEDPQRSAWLRVSEGWAGSGWGTQFLPRIGQEVLVDFLDGDPERPIIVGRLYNAGKGSGGTSLPFPSAAAASAQHMSLQALPSSVSSRWPMSGLRTHASPKPDGEKERFHLLRFDDTWKQEQVLIRSQGRLDETSFASTYHTAHGSRHIRVGGKDPDTGKAGGSLEVTVGDSEDRHIGKSRYTGIDENDETTIKGHAFFDIKDVLKMISANSIALSAPKIDIEASTKISLKVGNSFVVIDPSGVFITGPMVQINSGGAADTVSDADMTDPFDAAMADPGDPINWRELHKGSGGGGRHHHTAAASHGLAVTRNADGTFQVTKGVRVKGDPAYVSRVIEDLATINNTKDGHARLDRIDGSGHQVTIQNYDAANPKPPSPNADCTPGTGTSQDYANAGAPGKVAAYDTNGNPINDSSGNPVMGNGRGSDSTIHYDPNDWPSPTSTTHAPGDAILNHELGHADNQGHGRQDMTPRPDNYQTQEEFNNLPNDNAYRRERGIPERPNYGVF
jgi:uncharacterized protein involved in type VI secretion and phage assembly